MNIFYFFNYFLGLVIINFHELGKRIGPVKCSLVCFNFTWWFLNPFTASVSEWVKCRKKWVIVVGYVSGWKLIKGYINELKTFQAHVGGWEKNCVTLERATLYLHYAQNLIRFWNLCKKVMTETNFRIQSLSIPCRWD